MTHASAPSAAPEKWWRNAVIYQIYPRSFADGNGDGMGDLKGVEARLEALSDLGVDAIWFSPFMTSPQKDAGYDVSDYTDIDPLFGTLADFDDVLAKAHKLGLKVIVDLVPNHSSSEHPLFKAALASPKGSMERSYYHFADGKGETGELPPNNWQSVFGGPAWTRTKDGQWYLHIFDSSQPDFNWDNPEVEKFFHSVLRFWLDRGVDGFRVDVAHALIKESGLPDVDELTSSMTGSEDQPTEDKPHPHWGQEGVHDIIRGFRKVVDEYENRAMAAEAWILPLSKMAKWVREDEYHQAFNFEYLATEWEAKRLKEVVEESLEEFGAVGAPSTWVLSNHDVIRHVTRLSYDEIPKQGDGIGPDYPQPDEAKGQRIGRAASAFMLGLPGSSYLYQGEELGLPEHTTLEPEYRQDPTFFRTSGERVGRDGCRVPIPWEADSPAFGFNETGKSWLPQPENYRSYSRDQQEGVAGSTLELYKRLLKVRKELSLGDGSLDWDKRLCSDSTLAYKNGSVLVVANFGPDSLTLPAGEVLATTQPDLGVEGMLEHDQVAWIKL
ncbi:MAG: alpha-amylase [Candidatus Aquiluna sp. XM-24bin5]|nr:MAG: alpha-amylase [Candidatus Aquiluna sp. XM-24bin5]